MDDKKVLDRRIILGYSDPSNLKKNILYLQSVSPVCFTKKPNDAMSIPRCSMLDMILEVVKKEFPKLKYQGRVLIETVEFLTAID